MQNRRRGERARNHLERQRKRDREHLRSRERDRARARIQGEPSRLFERARRGALFALSIGAGILLATPVQEQITRWTLGELGRLESVAIQGNARLSSAKIAAATGITPGSPLSAVDPSAVEARLESQPWIREARVLRLPPSTLLVRVEERTPHAVLIGRDAPGAPALRRWVDESGTPFASAEDGPSTERGGVPHLIGGDALASGQPHAVLVTALALFERLRATGDGALHRLGGRMDLQLPAGATSEGWVLASPDRSLEVVLGHSHLFERFDRLRELLDAQLPGVEEAPMRIDLRFADQAVLRRVSASG
jgi:cell division protein FtsQ